MRIFHTSDTHLGHQQYARLSPAGLNQREEDIYASWARIIDHAVAERPDAFVHAGDLFDAVRPGNRALAAAMEGFLRLSKAGIPTVVIAGNHDNPRMRETGSPLRLFEHLDDVHVAYRARRETVTVRTQAGSVRIHAVPQCEDNASLAAEVTSASTQEEGVDVLVAHGAVPALGPFAHGEFNELDLETSWFQAFDYVALGHYHGLQEVTPNAWYCGAPERVSFAESGQQKGFLDVDLADPTRPRFRSLPARPYTDLRIDAEGLDAGAVREAAARALAQAPDGAVVRLTLDRLDASLRGTLDLASIQKAAAKALALDLRPVWQDAAVHVRGATDIGAIADEFEAFAASQPMAGRDRAAVLARARRLFAEAP